MTARHEVQSNERVPARDTRFRRSIEYAAIAPPGEKYHDARTTFTKMVWLRGEIDFTRPINRDSLVIAGFDLA